MLEHHVDVVALAGDVPDRLAELARRAQPLAVVSLSIGSGISPQQSKCLRLIAPLAPSDMHEVALVLLGDHRDRVAARGRDQLDRHRAQPAGATPDQHVVAGLERVRRVAEQHADRRWPAPACSSRPPPRSGAWAAASAGATAPCRTGRTSRRWSRSPRSAATGEFIGSPPLHSSSSPSSWLQWMTTSSPTFQRFTLEPTAQTMPDASEPAM